jgi:hypothetical protein
MASFSGIVNHDESGYESEAEELTDEFTFIKWQLAEIITEASKFFGESPQDFETSLSMTRRRYPFIEVSELDLLNASIVDALFKDLQERCYVSEVHNYLGDVSLLVGPGFSNSVSTFFKIDDGLAEFETWHLKVILEWLYEIIFPLVQRCFQPFVDQVQY